MGTPLFSTEKHIVKQLPVIPEIIGDAPHIGYLLEKLRLFQRCGSGRKAQHHITSAAVKRFAQHYKLRFLMRHLTGDIIALDKINAP